MSVTTQRMFCQSGHQWQTVEATLASTVCPVCGSVGTVAESSPAAVEADPAVDGCTDVSANTDEWPPLPQSSARRRFTDALPPTSVAIPNNAPLLPGYQIIREVGRGGMGCVYLALQTSLKRPVALKFVRAEINPDAPEADRFRPEAEAVASLQHPNIIQVYEVGAWEGRPYFAQEFLAGGDLAERINGTPWPPGPAAQLLQTLAGAIHYAHGRGIIHRDLKPANILFVSRSAAGISLDPKSTEEANTGGFVDAKITDFGIAKRLDDRSDRTKTGVVVGTPSYMAPEQAAGLSKQVGPRADVYALGAILYELLTGRPPFRAATASQTLHQVLHEEPLAPSRLVSRTPRDLETICLKCLQKSPTHRYASAKDLAEDLVRFQQGLPILAKRAALWERGWKWTRRRPALAGLIFVLATSLILGAFFGVQYSRDVGAERDKYLRQRNTARRATAEERRARQISDRHFDRAVTAVDQMLARAGMDAALEISPQMDEIRRGLLEDALSFYLEFLEEEGEDPQLRLKAAQVAERTASILMMMGRSDEAEAMYQTALNWGQELVERNPDEAIYRYYLSQTHTTLGLLYYRTGRLQEALEHLTSGLNYRRELAAEQPTDLVYQYQVAASLVDLALVERQVDRSEAEIHLQEAVTSGASLAQADATELKFAIVLGNARNNLGAIYLESDRLPDALAVFEANAEHWQKLAQVHPQSNMCQAELARGLSNLGQTLLQGGGDLNRAREAFTRAYEIRQQLEQEHPQILDHATSTAWSCLRLGELALHQNDHENAIQWSSQAIDRLLAIRHRAPQEHLIRQPLRAAYYCRLTAAQRTTQFALALADIQELKEVEDPAHTPQLRLGEAHCLAGLGRHSEAAAAVAALRDHAVTGDGYYALARVWSLCAAAATDDTSLEVDHRGELVAKYAEAALEMLQAARNDHRFDTPQEIEELLADAALEALQDRSDYQALLQSLPEAAGEQTH